MINPLNLLLMPNDKKIFGNYRNIPPFEISIYSNLDEINLKRQSYNSNFVIDTQITPFFNQADYSHFYQGLLLCLLKFLLQMKTLEDYILRFQIVN